MIDVTYFGYGLGLVIVPWAVGMAVGLVISVLESISK